MGELVSEVESGSVSPVVEGDERLRQVLIERQRAEEIARELSEKLSFQASHDALTGLLNRYEFEHRLRQLLADASENRHEHALCYMDLDQFKIINDACGHPAGDELLRQLGHLMRENVFQRDIVARLGGDEFGVLLEHCSLARAKKVAANLLRQIADFRFLWEGKSFSIGASIGLVPIVESSGGVPDVLRVADSACYVAKDEGRNRIRTYRTDDAELVRRSGEMRWVNRIRLALEENRFQLDYQPIVGMGGARNGSEESGFFELLLRMQDEAGRRIPPDNFMPAAERYHLATQIDTWVLRSAFEWLTQHPETVQRIRQCSINLSGQSLADLDFLRFVLRQLEEKAIPPERICFEITETAAIANLAQATHFIRTLRTLGCRFALDDFGTGFSSFAYLKNLPVDYLKIDGMFVIDMTRDRFDQAVVRSIVEIAKVTGKQTIAESVENTAVLNRLKRVGVDFAQGNGIARPQPLEGFEWPAPSEIEAESESRPEQLALPF
ncbi:MAG: EAL domain-containing protein [Acidobacteriota bacterium]